MPSPAQRERRMIAPILGCVAALGYAAAVVVVAWRAPDKGFVAFTGRRVIHVVPGGAAEAAGMRRGDVIVAVDGAPLRTTYDYTKELLGRRPGGSVTLELEDAAGARRHVVVPLARAGPPLPSIAASALAAILLFLGLVARWGRPGDPAARRFFRTALVFAIVYAGALSWTHLVVHPPLLAIFLAAMFMAPALAMDFLLTFPSPPPRPVRGWRLVGYGPSLLLLLGTVGAFALAGLDRRAGRASDRGLEWAVRLVGAQLLLTVVAFVGGLRAQRGQLREASGGERGQRKWMHFGFALAVLPAFMAVPAAAADLDWFLLVGYRPYVAAVAILWFAAVSLAVLRVRLADVDTVIHRSVTYAAASGGAAAVYVAVVLGVGLVADRLFGAARLAPHLLAAAAAAMLFGPIRDRVTVWIDRRFFRDRQHYVRAVREVGEAAAPLREPRELAREVVERAVTALRAAGGALYLAPADRAGPLELAHARGDGFPAAWDDAGAAPPDGVAVPIRRDDGRPSGLLVLGARRGGDLYSQKDRDLLLALAGQLAVSFENARAYGTIAAMSRTLEEQNREIRELRDRLEDENRYLRARLDAAGDGAAIIGASKAIRELQRQLERVAATPAVVLLQGESGTGKGLCARAIHAASDRADKPFIHVDCGAIPAGLFESELFGHERGAFTGAVRNRRGHFELADGGTLFLDEIGELPLPLQPKLLRALQERSFLRVGGSHPVTVDVRIIAATNRALAAMVERGEFREDLFYRVRVVEIDVPPLRARKSDLPALVDFLLPRLCRRNHKPPRSVSEAAMARMAAYGWPGNVRELENVLERAAVLCEGREIGEDDLALPDRPPPPEELAAEAVAVAEDAGHADVMEAIEKRRLVAALRAAGGNQSHAARALGMARTTLINKLRRYGLL